MRLIPLLFSLFSKKANSIKMGIYIIPFELFSNQFNSYFSFTIIKPDLNDSAILARIKVFFDENLVNYFESNS